MKEHLDVTGTVKLRLHDREGNLIMSMATNNLVTTAGKNFIVRKINNDAEDIDSISIGSGTTAPALTDSDVETELANNSVLFQSVDTVNTNEILFTTTFEENVGTGTINEVGLFTDSNTLVCRTVLSSPFEKSASEYLTVTWKIKIG